MEQRSAVATQFAAMFAAVMLLAALLTAGCGDGGPSLTEYADELETLVDTMNGRLDQLDADLDEAPSLAATKQYARERVAARQEFVAGMELLEPPPDVEDLHAAGLAILGRVAAAEERLAQRVYELESDIGLESVWDLPEGIAARQADQEAIELCLSAQSEFDQTQLRRELGDVPWVPPEMKEVILVTFGCLAEER